MPGSAGVKTKGNTACSRLHAHIHITAHTRNNKAAAGSKMCYTANIRQRTGSIGDKQLHAGIGKNAERRQCIGATGAFHGANDLDVRLKNGLYCIKL